MRTRELEASMLQNRFESNRAPNDRERIEALQQDIVGHSATQYVGLDERVSKLERQTNSLVLNAEKDKSDIFLGLNASLTETQDILSKETDSKICEALSFDSAFLLSIKEMITEGVRVEREARNIEVATLSQKITNLAELVERLNQRLDEEIRKREDAEKLLSHRIAEEQIARTQWDEELTLVNAREKTDKIAADDRERNERMILKELVESSTRITEERCHETEVRLQHQLTQLDRRVKRERNERIAEDQRLNQLDAEEKMDRIAADDREMNERIALRELVEGSARITEERCHETEVRLQDQLTQLDQRVEEERNERIAEDQRLNQRVDEQARKSQVFLDRAVMFGHRLTIFARGTGPLSFGRSGDPVVVDSRDAAPHTFIINDLNGGTPPGIERNWSSL